MSNSDNDINISSPETTRPSIKRKQNEVNFNALRQHAKKLRIGVTSNSSPSGQSKYFNKSTVSTVNHTAFNAEDYVLSYSLIDDILSFCDAKKVGNATLHVTRLKKPVRINSDIDSFGLNDVDWENDFIASPVNKPVTLDRSVVSFNQIRDNTGEYQETFSFSFALVNVLHTVFGLKTYRPRQIEIINATLANEDCFVLIPTGGGKSLCYQLPAVVSIGVTVVISPLRALISDQVNKLNALKIRAAHLCMGVKKSEMNHIIQKLYMREPPLKLLYLTPEKIKSSERVIKAFKSLYARGRLARFVIDEVHCLSNWGHDFRFFCDLYGWHLVEIIYTSLTYIRTSYIRKFGGWDSVCEHDRSHENNYQLNHLSRRDYVQLSCLRRNYPNVPLICLTATATNLVQADVIKILGLSSVKTFTHSFNRPNIKYTILPKENKSIVTDIAKLIKARFNKQTGIVYCLCRADCDKLAKEFNRLAIRAKSYHAGMKDKDREGVQRDWMNDVFFVIVATIAFGMGIDKPNVRFVIHNSVPKSIEAFYQESGRAGRDGKTAYSYLFYSYADVMRLKKLVQRDRNGNKNTLDHHFNSLQEMAIYCENITDCRRYLQLSHLGENFDRRNCIANTDTTCDNCQNVNRIVELDITHPAQELAQMVKELGTRENLTMIFVGEIYKGARTKKIVSKGYDKYKLHGSGKQYSKPDIRRILKQLLFKKILQENASYAGDFPVVYVKVGNNFNSLFNANMKLTMGVLQTKSPIPKILSIKNATLPISNPPASVSVKMHNLKVRCHEELLQECQQLAQRRTVTLCSVMNLSAIKTMSELLPTTRREMMTIQHVTLGNYEKFGETLLAITKRFRAEVDALAVSTIVREEDFTDEINWSDDEHNQVVTPFRKS